MVAQTGGGVRVAVTGAGPCVFRSASSRARSPATSRPARSTASSVKPGQPQQRHPCQRRISRASDHGDGEAGGRRRWLTPTGRVVGGAVAAPLLAGRTRAGRADAPEPLIDHILVARAAVRGDLSGVFRGPGGLSGRGRGRGLGAFVFNFAIPPLRLPADGRDRLAAIAEWGFLGGYLGAQALVFVISAGLGRLLFGLRPGRDDHPGLRLGVLQRRDAGAAAAALALRRAGGVPALLIITLDVIVFSSGHGAARARRRGGGRGRRGRIVLQARARCWSTRSSWRPCSASCSSRAASRCRRWSTARSSFIGQAAAPSALFALGATLSLRRIAGSLGPAGLMVACKLFVHPLLAWLASPGCSSSTVRG